MRLFKTMHGKAEMRIGDKQWQFGVGMNRNIPVLSIGCQEGNFAWWRENGKEVIATQFINARDVLNEDEILKLIIGTEENAKKKFDDLLAEKKKSIEKETKKIDELWAQVQLLLDYLEKVFPIMPEEPKKPKTAKKKPVKAPKVKKLKPAPFVR